MLSRKDFDLKIDNLFKVLERKPNDLFCDDLYHVLKNKYTRYIIYKVVDNLKYSGKRFFTIEDFVTECDHIDKTVKRQAKPTCGYCTNGLQFYEDDKGHEYTVRCSNKDCDASEDHNYPSELDIPLRLKKLIFY